MPTHCHYRKAAHGFTLIELLTVIAIIAILAAIIIPLTGRVKEKASRTQCASNLRQIALSAILYANESNGSNLPAIRNDSEGYQQWMFNSDFLKLLGEHQTNKAADLAEYFRCPTSINNGSTLSIHYGMNVTGLGINGSNYKEPGYAPNMRAEDPANTIYLMDGLDWWLQQNRSSTDYSQTGESSTTYAPAYRHGNAANVAFLDGHVELLDRNTLIEETDLWNYR